MPIANPSSSSQFNVSALLTDQPLCFPGGRLTLSSTNPIADASGVTTFHYLPFTHGVVPFWNNSAQLWEYRPIPESGIAINRTGDNPRIVDIYAQAYSNSPNGFGIDLQTWTNDTTRFSSTPLVRKNGILCVSFNNPDTPLRTYLGSIRFVGNMGSATMVDSDTQRFVFNAYNRVNKRVIRYETADSWQNGNGTWRRWNNSSANRIEILDGIGNGLIDLTFTARAVCASGVYAQYGFGVDTITTVTDSYVNNNNDQHVIARLSRVLGQGYHYVQAMESAVAGTPTFYGQGYLGLQGTWQC